jgi:predicted DNA-binding transcriptional regulator YafY
VPVYGRVYEDSLGEDGDRDRARDALRKQLERDVEALSGAGIWVEVRGTAGGRRYRLPAAGFSPAEVELTREERAVLTGALRTLSRDFPYAGPLRLAVANLMGAISSVPEDDEDKALFAAALSASEEEAVARRVAQLESAVSRRKRVRFGYYSISRDETSEREVEPYALSLLDGTWYVTGRDLEREAIRQFRLSRIRGRIMFSTRKERGDYEVPENFERRLAAARAPWQLGEPDRSARVRVSDETFAAARKRYTRAISLGGHDNGKPLLCTRYSEERQLAAWVLSLGEGACVLEPESLAGRVVAALERIAETHSTAGRGGET